MKKSYHSSAEPTAAASITCLSVFVGPSPGRVLCATSSPFSFFSAGPPYRNQPPHRALPAGLNEFANPKVAIFRSGLIFIDRALMGRRRERHAYRHVNQA